MLSRRIETPLSRPLWRIREITTRMRSLMRRRVVRYALVGGVGIPVHDLALFLFLSLFGAHLFPLASACSFEVSTTVNFILNQLYTYSDQRHVHGLGWVRRALAAQVASFSALIIAYAIGLVLAAAWHLNLYVANDCGIIVSFAYNFMIANRFVFRPSSEPPDPSLHGSARESEMPPTSG